MSDAPEAAPAPAKASEPHPLDALTGGAFSAATSGERASRIREWLATQPAQEQLQEVFKELSARDKGAARAVRERLDEIKRMQGQEAIAAEWADKANALLGASRLSIADALAWQRDAAKAGAPLSREPLSALKTQIADRVKVIEDLQHRVQVQRETAVLLAQRIEVLSTKSFRDAEAALDNLTADVNRWQEHAQELMNDASWASVEARFPPMLESSRTQLLAVWDAFKSALAQTTAAAASADAPMPSVQVWADEIRVLRGQPTEADAHAAKSAQEAAKPKVDPEVRKKAQSVVREALAKLEQETAEGHGKASIGAAAALRTVLKANGRHVDGELEQKVNAALIAAGELEGWQRWSADQVREDLVNRAEALLKRPEGQELGGRKMQETLRQLREQWKASDQGAPANHALWKRFDEACNAAHKVVEDWLDKVRAEAAEHKGARMALVEEVKAWTAAHAASTDWKAMSRALHQFSERWRNGGHVSEKVFAELQPLWKQVFGDAARPLETEQKQSLDRRQAMIQESAELSAAPMLRIDAVKALQQRWQAEAQSVPLDRKREQKLWDAFRKPIDDAFQRKSADRDRQSAELSARDKAVLDAAKALEAANASGDVQAIRSAMDALDAAMRNSEAANAAAAAAADGGVSAEAAPAENAAPDDAAAAGSGDAEAEAKPAAAKPVRPVVAVRGDDRPGANRPAAAAPTGRPGRPGERNDRGGRGDRNDRGDRGDARFSRDGRDARGGRGRDDDAPRAPRLGDSAFRAQRDALDHAQNALRKLAAQAHGETLTRLLSAWEGRDAEKLPSAQELGRLQPAVRSAWAQALGSEAKPVDTNALLRLEIAADVPTPADQITARRAYQLQLLTRRNDPSPQETWGKDVASVLASASDETTARRLQNALKVLLKK
ncbi:DUF349 domain-containing protein [Diaphorobacter aerolatus]|uniref:DUF349 domain-containing protein n=1 Tax=Diaphorobacter aerolatus TaxID=1288495 RepID=A0A7H0GJS7_9BURK|nr:DUF349 domain-containing protein [Diaphorobacter aerolatus]QNP48543.1 DUF349 domain-containing protein [Diaphorobacter aerolatus]